MIIVFLSLNAKNVLQIFEIVDIAIKMGYNHIK